MTGALHGGPQLPAGLRGRTAAAVGVFLVFAIAGPPLAAVLAVGIIPFFNRPGAALMPASLDNAINGFANLVAMAYFFGGLQAIVMGLIASIWQYSTRAPRVSLVLVLLASSTIAIMSVIVFAAPFSMPSPHPGIVTSVLALHVGAATGCWLIANAHLRAQERRRAATDMP